MTETTFENAKVGDRVWTPFGPEADEKGQNATIKKTSDCDVLVQHDEDYGQDNFTFGGLYYCTDSAPTLFWSRPEIIPPAPPGGGQMKAIINFKNFNRNSVQWEIIKEWIEEQIALRPTDHPTDHTFPLRYADSVEFKED